MALKGSPNISFFIIAGRPLTGLLEKFSDEKEAKTERSDGLGENTDRHEPTGDKIWEMSLDAWYNLGGTGDPVVGSTAASTTYAANTATDGAAWDLSGVTPLFVIL